MAKGSSPSRRERVEPGIYVRTAANGRKAFEIGFRDAQGRQRWRRVEGGILAARRALAKAHASRARGERVAADPRLRFSDAAESWWKARVANMRPTTQATYQSALKHLHERFGRSRLSDITPGDVAAFVADQQRRGYKGWSIKGHLATLSGVFKYAGRHLGFTGINPVSLLDKIERPGLEDERPKRTLSADELRRLIAAIDEPYRLLFETAAETGARLGEVLGLVWSEVDLDEQTITFTHQLGKRGERVPLKTKRSRRCVEITPGLAAKLRAAKLATSVSGDHDYVFVSRAETPHDHRNIGGRVLSRAVTQAGLEAVERDSRIVEHAPTFHTFRHSHGSALIASGWDLEEVSARLGHANVSTTMRAYVHEYEAARRSDDRRTRLGALYQRGESSTDSVVTALPRR